MALIVPSQVVTTIDAIVSANQAMCRIGSVPIDLHTTANLRAILALVRRVPEDFIVLSSIDYAAFTCAQAAIETLITKSLRRTVHEELQLILYLNPIPGFGDVNPLFLLRDTLEKCPDEYPPSTISSLRFIEPGYRDLLQLDIGAVDRALTNGEWKAATVLAGSVVEALLLWAIKTAPSSDVAATLTALVATRQLQKNPGPNPDWWQLVGCPQDTFIIRAASLQ